MLAVACNYGGGIFGATMDAGLFLTTNQGASWTNVSTKVFQSLLLVPDGTIFGGTDGTGLLRSTDNGNSWGSLTNGISDTTIYGLAMDPNGYLYAGGRDGGIYRSYNMGQNWFSLGNAENSEVVCFAFMPGGLIFAGTYGKGIYSSTNDGVSWAPANVGLSNLYVQSLAQNVVGTLYAGTDGGVFRSTDKGGSWTKISSAWTAAVHKVLLNSRGYIYAGTQYGLYRSTDDGADWTLLNSGLSPTNIGAQVIDPGGKLIAGAWGGGVFQTTESVDPLQNYEYKPSATTLLLLHLNEQTATPAYDSGPYGVSGSVNATNVIDGRYGKGRGFSGTSDYVTVPDFSPLDFSTERAFTAECWAWIDPVPLPEGTILSKWGPGNDEDDEWAVGVRPTGLQFDVNSSTSSGSANTTLITSDGQVPRGQWIHVACVWDGKARWQALYVNGVLVRSSSNAVETIPNTAVNFRVGYNGAGGAFKGMIDEVRISKGVRTPDEFNVVLAPYNLSAVASGMSINLQWQHRGVVPAARYRVYRGTDSTSVTLIDSTAATSYTDASAMLGVRHYYRIGAVDLTGFESGKSNIGSTASSSHSLVAYYPFNGNAHDSSGNGRHGTAYGATLTADRFGRPNSAYAFDGVNNYIKASGLGLPSMARTVSLWFKANSVSNKPGLLGYGGSGVCGTSWHEGLNIKGLGSYIVTSHCNVKELSSPYASAPLGNWYHWVVSTDSTGTRMFVNGAPIDSNLVFFDNTYTAGGDLAFGTLVSWAGLAPFTDQNCGNFNGELDDIRIYDYPLTAAQVSALYFQESHPPAPDAVIAAGPPQGFVTGADSIVVRWHPVAPPVIHYRVEASSDSTFQFIAADSTGGDTTYTIRSLQAPRQYWWRVCAFNGWVNGPYSGARAFHVVTLPEQVQLLLPAQGQLVFADSVSMSWQEAQQFVDRYMIDIATDSLFNFKFSDSTVSSPSYVARGLSSSRIYWWRVKAHNAAGWGPSSDVRKFSLSFTGVDGQREIPAEYTLFQNYPNPFNPSTLIRYGLPKRSHVLLVVYSTVGQKVAEVVNGEQEAGYHEVRFDGSGFASGLYLFRLQSGDFIQTRKLLLLR